ncbi:Adhesion G-protein coupled receptor G4 [Merluccius polli]|uniref:Adhesion G-protein coupled receptor G4 n=1 Tax=Merluccius polli TaxID=89951 RepID=A0AA47P636_MERPO|nr:Adhesion G-protein coupled receptor G4 [Merluccius polli]
MDGAHLPRKAVSTLGVVNGGAHRPLLAVQQNALGAADTWSHPSVHTEVPPPTDNTEPRAPISKPTVLTAGVFNQTKRNDTDCHKSPSLWGTKAEFMAKSCMWQLDAEVVVPALEELSACVLLRLALKTEWTAFAYNAPGGFAAELGLEGDLSHITAVLFGSKWSLNETLTSNHWHSVCLTWSNLNQKLRLYVDGTRRLDVNVNSSRRLVPSGTLTLGVPHFVDENGVVTRADGKSLMGDIGRFTMWARERRAEDLTHLGCVEGDLVRWDTRHWKYLSPSSCPPHADQTLSCDWSSYKIKMWTYVAHSNTSDTTNSSLESITRHWMESVFSQNISVQKVSVPSLSFFSKVYVSVSPKNRVEWVQAHITERLRAKFSYHTLTLMTDVHRLSIQPVDTPDLFFRVNLTLAFNGSSTNAPYVIENWSLTYNAIDRYYSTFHVQGNPWNITELEILITDSLTKEYRNDTLSIQTRLLAIQHIAPKSCPEDLLETIYGRYYWAETFPQREQVMRCQKPISGTAYRFCKLDNNTDMTSWEDPDMTACNHIMISDLDKVNVTAGNAVEVVKMIQDLINVELGTGSGGDGELSASDMVTVVEKLSDVVDVSVVTDFLCDKLLNVISVLLISKTDMNSVANMVLNLTERIGDKAVFSNDSFNVATPALALSMINVQPDNFEGITFCISSFSADMIPEIMVNQSFDDAIPGTVATIALPPAIQNLLVVDGNKTRIQFQFYAIQDLFNDKDISVGAEGNWTLNSYVISASINNSTVSNLQEQRVAVTLGNTRAKQDVSRAPISDTDSEILTVISYLGCGISSIFLGITLVTYLAFGKLRRDYPSKILINLSAALLALNLLYLVNTWLSSFRSYSLCILTAMLLHYSLLAAFTWMGLEALHMYFALVKVFNVYVPSYMLKFCAVGWGGPLVIVGLVLATDVDAYGNNMPAGEDQTSEPFCWVQSDVHFYVTVVALILLILLCNISVFVVVLIQIRRMQTNKPPGKLGSGSSMQDLRAAASLTFLLGLTWIIAFFSFGPGRMVLLYLFCVFNSLQGFFIFLFHCLMKENVRKQWRIYFKHKDSSDWSRSLTASGPPKQKQEVHSQSLGSLDTLSIIKVSGSSSESGPVRPQRE